MYLTRDDRDTLISYLQSLAEHDFFLEGYEEGFKRAVNMACDLIDTCDNYDDEGKL